MMIDFSVWFDHFLQEWVACPTEEITQDVLLTLEKEKVKVIGVRSTTALDALDQVRPRLQKDQNISGSIPLDFKKPPIH